LIFGLFLSCLVEEEEKEVEVREEEDVLEEEEEVVVEEEEESFLLVLVRRLLPFVDVRSRKESELKKGNISSKKFEDEVLEGEGNVRNG